MRFMEIFQYRCFLLPGAILAATACGGLEATVSTCDAFPETLSEALNTDISVEETEKTEAVEDAMAKIKECYPDMAYSRVEHPLLFERVSFGSDGRFYIFYSFSGIFDDMIVFRLGHNGEIDAAFSYSPLSRFAVPE